MSKRRNEDSRQLLWSPVCRRVVSLVLLLHLSAVVIAPWASPPPAPELAQRLARLVRPYVVAVYLTHGYRFFAPNPGPSHIIRYEMEMPDGVRREGRIPDPHVVRPRLIYHRHFMITERLFSGYTLMAPGPPPEFLPPSEKREWEARNRAAREQVERLARGVARQLLQQQGGARIRLFLQEHALPFPEDVKEGMPLNAPQLYRDVTEFGPYEKGTS